MNDYSNIYETETELNNEIKVKHAVAFKIKIITDSE